MTTTCLFIGGAKHPKYVRGAHAQEKQHRMVASVQQDFRVMLNFAAEHTEILSRRGPGARQTQVVRHDMLVGRMLLNSDISGSAYGDMGRMFNSGKSKHLLADATKSSYSDKNTVRRAVRDFLEHSQTKNLILFMTGHGQQVKRPGEVVEESFLLPMPDGADSEHYTDTDLTEDLVKLPRGKKLYIICHSCHSGGMINFWELNSDRKWVVVFASAEADILAEWNTWETDKGFLETFCEKAERGRMLCDIAGDILAATANPERRIRPAFICMRPEYARERFLQ